MNAISGNLFQPRMVVMETHLNTERVAEAATLTHPWRQQTTFYAMVCYYPLYMKKIKDKKFLDLHWKIQTM